MSLDRILYFIGILAWILLALYIISFFVRNVPYEGFARTFYRLLVHRVLYIFVAIVVSLSLLNSSVVFVQPEQVGVVVSLISPDGYRDRPLRSGLRWIIPLAERARIYPIAWQTYTMASRPDEGQQPGNDAIGARTSDGQQVWIDCTVIFQIDAEQVIRINIDWQNRYMEEFIRPVTRGIVRTQVSQFTVDEVNSFKRLDLEREINETLRAELREKGFLMDRFILRNIAFSPEYASSVERKQVALQEVIEKQHQADQIRRLAAGQADQIEIMAKAEAEAIRIRSLEQAEALRRLSQAIADNDHLLAYEYIQKLAPDTRVMILPSNTPYLFQLPNIDETAERAAPIPPDGIVAPTLLISPTIGMTSSITSTVPAR